MGYLTNIRVKPRYYVEENEGAQLIPFGGDHPIIIEGNENAILSLDIEPPKEVWTVMSSGVLSRGLQLAQTDVKVYGVRIGHNTTERERGRSLKHSYRNTNSIKNVKNQKDLHSLLH